MAQPPHTDADLMLISYLYDELDTTQRGSFERGLVDSDALRRDARDFAWLKQSFATLDDIEPPTDGYFAILRESKLAMTPATTDGFWNNLQRLFRSRQGATAIAFALVVVTATVLVARLDPHPDPNRPDEPNISRNAPTMVPTAKTENMNRGQLTSGKSPAPVIAPAPPPAMPGPLKSQRLRNAPSDNFRAEDRRAEELKPPQKSLAMIAQLEKKKQYNAAILAYRAVIEKSSGAANEAARIALAKLYLQLDKPQMARKVLKSFSGSANYRSQVSSLLHRLNPKKKTRKAVTLD